MMQQLASYARNANEKLSVDAFSSDSDSSNNESKTSFFYPPNKITELDSVVMMTKFYPWIVRYAQLKGLDPDKPRYLTKVTQTF